MLYDSKGDTMAKSQVTVRLDKDQLVRARKALKTGTVTETIERALAMATEKAAHDGIIRKFSGVGGKEAFANR
jgi:hypothetical protein